MSANPRPAALVALCAFVLVACSGAQPPVGSDRPGASAPTVTSQPAQATSGAPVSGEPIDSDGVAAAVAALQAHDSWTFEATYWASGQDTGLEQAVTGTERRSPQAAIDGLHAQPTGGNFRYIRIDDDIWTDVGTGDFFHTDAAAAENLIDQYEPFYLAALVEAAERSDIEFEPMSEELVNGTAAIHYELSEFDRENIVQTLDIQPSDWAGDVWLSKADGSLLALKWGPQTKETAGPLMGFSYEVTSIDCACPIEPPA